MDDYGLDLRYCDDKNQELPTQKPLQLPDSYLFASVLRGWYNRTLSDIRFLFTGV